MKRIGKKFEIKSSILGRKIRSGRPRASTMKDETLKIAILKDCKKTFVDYSGQLKTAVDAFSRLIISRRKIKVMGSSSKNEQKTTAFCTICCKIQPWTCFVQ